MFVKNGLHRHCCKRQPWTNCRIENSVTQNENNLFQGAGSLKSLLARGK